MRRTPWHLVTNSLVLAWLTAAALVGFAHRAVPAPRWLLVHLLVLGGATTAIMIWSNHFTVTLLRRPDPPTHRAEGLRLAALTSGVLAVVCGVVADHWWLTLAGATLVTGAVVAHVVSLVRQLRRALVSRFAVCVRYYVAAGLLLPVGVALGATMARGQLSSTAHARLLDAHLLLNVLGWIGLTVVGTLVTLWPTLLRTRIADGAEADARRALPLLVGGLVAAAGGSLAGLVPVVGLGLVVYLGGLAVAARAFVDALRRKPPNAFPAWSVLLAGGWLVGTVTALLVRLVVGGRLVDEAALRWVTASLLVGFVAQVLVGALTGLGPVVMGGGPAMLRRTIPVAERFSGARLVGTNAGLLLCVLPVPSLVRVVCSVVVLVSLSVTIPLLVRATLVSRRKPTEQAGAAGPAAGQELRGPQRTEPSAATWLGSLAVGAAAVTLAVVLGVVADPLAIGAGTRPAALGSVVPTGQTTTVEVTAAGMRFTPASVEVPYGNRLVIVVTNRGDQVHDLVLDTGATSGRLAVGQTAQVDVGVVGRNIDGWCSIAGHRQMGMVFAVHVTGADTSAQGAKPSPSPGESDHAGMPGMGGGAVIDPMADPGPGFQAYDPVLPPVPPGRVHRFTFTVQEIQREVSPGVMQESWTYNGTVPGPVLHGKVGDRFVITLVNDGTMGHSIDFHAGALAPDRPMRTINPGERLTYRFTATRSGIWMYHCSTMPMSLHIANGLFGAVVIDPPDLPPVDREYVLVQSELYLGAPGAISDASKVNAEQPDGVVFNGYVAQYDHDPLVARVGERVRIWVLDAGPSRSLSFHVVGGQFDTVFTEGRYELRPGNAERGGAQVLPLLPAQGGFVELTFPQAGHYPFVNHVMVDAERGAHGIVAVTR